jgi:hypothetical protein
MGRLASSNSSLPTLQPGNVSAVNRGETHFRIYNDTGTTWDDQLLATTPADQPPNPGKDGSKFLPYLGDYLHLLALDPKSLWCVLREHTPDNSNFPAGVSFQSDCNMNSHTLFDLDGATPVSVWIDPFFFKMKP